MKGMLVLGPFDSALRHPLRIELELKGTIISEARLETGPGRRDVELCFERSEPSTGLFVAARICERSSLAHSLAFCQALEDAARVELEDGPSALRVVLTEYERIAAHLGVISDLGRALEDDMLFYGPMRYVSRIRSAFEAAGGSAFGFGMIVPGGVRIAGDPGAIGRLSGETRQLGRDVGFWKKKMSLSKKRLDMGRIGRELIGDDPPPAPAFRATGIEGDLRSGEGAYGYYRELEYRPVTRDGGTSLDRMELLLGEVRSSLALIKEVETRGVAGPGEVERLQFERVSGVGLCESPEGAVEHRILLGSEGMVDRGRVLCASEAVARVAGHALEGLRYEDVVPALVSLDLCGACIEL